MPLPSAVLLKPLCGLRHRCSSGAYGAAWSMWRFNAQVPQGLEFAAVLAVVRPKEGVHLRF